ncbi:MAG: helicase [Ilumatobacteraceae bacterium]|nr:helicase [Ilumatobacteraceae bacterium]
MPTLPTDPSDDASGGTSDAAADHAAADHAAARRRIVVAAAARTWAAQLVDLGGRITLLHYRDLSAGTLALTSAAAPALAALLDGRSVRLSALFPGDPLADAARRLRTVTAKARENFEERGLSTLYVATGMATWKAESGTTAPAAPVLLAEVTVRPIGALENDFDLAVTDEWEPNPTLLHLLATQFQVRVEADDLLAAVEAADGDLAAAGTALAAAAASVPGWGVDRRTVIGNFSYAKQPMVLDLEAGVDVMCASTVIAALAGDAAAVAQLRSAAPAATLDEPDRIAPSDEFVVIDADASQHFVINAAARGADLVVQGPPGTGKSQTIANLIASLAASGKSVLFVAEKRAAIDAVVDRLDRAGLRDLVLDLYGGGGSRRTMAAELRRVYDASAAVPSVRRDVDDARLVDRRSRLNVHSAAMHEPRAPWQVTVYELQAGVLAVPPALRLPLRLGPVDTARLDRTTLGTHADALADWLTTGGPAVETGVSPWASAATTITDPATAEATLGVARHLATESLPALAIWSARVAAECGLRQPPTINDWIGTVELLKHVAIVDDLHEDTIWALDLDALTTALQPAARGAIGRAAASMFNGAYRAAKKQVATTTKRAATPVELLGTVTTAAGVRRAWIAAGVDGGSPRLPAGFVGTVGTFEATVAELTSLASHVGERGLLDADLPRAQRRVESLLGDTPTLYRLPTLHELATRLDAAGLGPIRRAAAAKGLDATAARHLLEHTWSASVLEQISFADPRVGAFDGTTHARVVDEFATADRAQIASGAAKVRRAVAERLVSARNAQPAQDALVAAEVRKKSRYRTLRELTQQAPDVLLALKPCWAMSPLAVSQLLDARPLFDVVVFDEASQVPPADAIPALMRGRQAIVAGDSKQLPPTAFFASATSADDGESGADSGGAVDDGPGNLTVGTESVLDAMANVVTGGSTTLRWHYRSRDERLIAFSNAQRSLYDWQMVTFPGTSAAGDAIRHVHVPWRAAQDPVGGSVDSAGDEVRRVVELIAEHAHAHPERSLGVIAMGIQHAERITDALRAARHDDGVLDEFCATRHPAEPLFVKNLERVQGDERDSIILTVGYGKNAAGAMVYRFGPINQAGGERRLNVAITRSRSQMTVVSSFLPSDLDPAKLNSEGAQMLGRYLAYAASGGTDLGSAGHRHPALDAFQTDVRDRLAAAGIEIVAQLGVSGFCLDFAAAHPERPGEWVLAAETDGGTYRASATARERDRLRKEHLVRLGWVVHRIWSTDWFRDPDAEVARIVATWQSACVIADARRAAGVSRAVPAWAPPVAGTISPPPAPNAASAPKVARTLPRPPIEDGAPIADYTVAQLSTIVAWVASDDLLRTDTELREAVADEMGYSRIGSRIRQRVDDAIAEHRRQH